ncbi:MAG: DUF4230 domain-containing protein [Spirulina sp. SIO3F2]|nr:DUF4230 domain-containing protein [Spirulina sp. SIO3F2]
MIVKHLNKLLWLTGGSITTLALLTLILILRGGGAFWAGAGRWLSVREAEPVVDAPTLIVQSIREASELTTAVYSLETVVPTSQDRVWGDVVVGTTKLLYIAYGEVRAGIDLSQLDATDVQVAAEQLTVQLPPPQILDRLVDVGRSQVYDYNRGFLSLGPDVAPQLQTLAEREALAKLDIAACEQDILERANERAATAITELLTLSGYDNVVVNTTPADDCAELQPNNGLESPPQ